ncbi:hypothetical protein SAMN05444156_2171 [Verrucomicrobium sp. GAS474]|uniref:hypothetical protein n=1 Tax=Verrucomicrobium sp. GAS474 TaxID=1882831 RepID=UPI00087D2C4F|nr:hypothetical protein [Verrucomicrobium sp. GAS474]SDU13575.1 hypothetical protein SAMN05444156_2171 [Verrucomicrobium sp. GAS474]
MKKHHLIDQNIFAFGCNVRRFVAKRDPGCYQLTRSTKETKEGPITTDLFAFVGCGEIVELIQIEWGQGEIIAGKAYLPQTSTRHGVGIAELQIEADHYNHIFLNAVDIRSDVLRLVCSAFRSRRLEAVTIGTVIHPQSWVRAEELIGWLLLDAYRS